LERKVSLGDLVARMVSFVRAGHPRPAPATGYVPLRAVLQRGLSNGEVVAVAFELARRGADPVGLTDIRVAINAMTDEMPSPADTDRVRWRLESAGWEVTNDFRATAAE
jgi:uncharacterized protein DUF3349